MSVHIVDDDSAILECISEIVSDAGYQVLSFNGGQAYLDHMNKLDYTTPSMLITDVDMPDVNGFDLIKHVLNKYPDMNISVISGHTKHKTRADELNVHFLSKPFHPDELINLISATA